MSRLASPRFILPSNISFFTASGSSPAITRISLERAVLSAMLGFGFVDKDVVDIQTACSEAWKKLAPILYGYVDFDENYPAAIAELEAAGINEFVAEVNRQLEEYMAK